MGGYDLQTLTEEEREAFYRHPAELPSPEGIEGVWAFASEEAENRWADMLRLRVRAALGPVRRVVFDPAEWAVVWTDGEQVALRRRARQTVSRG